jgi:hypothetical protein
VIRYSPGKLISSVDKLQLPIILIISFAFLVPFYPEHPSNQF